MHKKEHLFNKNEMFTYDLAKKRLFVIIAIAIILVGTLSLFLLMQNKDSIITKTISSMSKHIFDEIKSSTNLGIFYTALVGGLFFVIIPMEPLFSTHQSQGANLFILITLYIAGMIISYTINYSIGKNFAKITKKIITPQKFYELKGQINKYGVWAIFFINVLPLPSQPLSAILGVFKYNKTKFYIYFVAGQLVKYLTIGLAGNYVIGLF